MAYTSEVIRRASQLLERRRTALKSQQRALRAEVYERIPDVRAIDGRLRAGMLALTAAALDHGTDPAPRVADIRAQNTALRARRAELLTQNGFEPDCLDDKPFCPDCEDRGWIGTRMCSCLKELCAQEQIKSLSSLLDLGEQSFENFSLDWYSTAYDEELGLSPPGRTWSWWRRSAATTRRSLENS